MPNSTACGIFPSDTVQTKPGYETTRGQTRGQTRGLTPVLQVLPSRNILQQKAIPCTMGVSEIA